MTKLVTSDQSGGGGAVAVWLGKLGPTKRTFLLIGTAVVLLESGEITDY